jgi:hypothetical protein
MNTPHSDSGFAYKDEFVRFLNERIDEWGHQRVWPAKNYPGSVKRAAKLTGKYFTPDTLSSLADVDRIMENLQSKIGSKRKLYSVRCAVKAYVDMVSSNFEGRFTQCSAKESLPARHIQRGTEGALVTPLLAKGRRLLEAIVRHITTQKVDVSMPATYPTYDFLYHAVDTTAPKVVRFVGRNLRFKGLDELNDWTMANKSLPKVTGLIVDRTTKRPNNQFFECYNRTPVKDDNWWREEVRKALAFDWSPYMGTQQATSPIVIADDLDEDELAPRVKGEVSRIVRDTRIVREVKALHDHTCQICGLRLELSPGVFYSEAHHLKPLGKPHRGPDKKANVVCVCPNCHVKLDFHAVRIAPAKLRTETGHSVAQRFIDHHNNLCR